MSYEYEAPTLFMDILKQAHTLIAGQTGSGKSVMLNGILTTACKQGNNLMILIDPKRVELCDYKKLPNCIAYANTSAECVRALNKAIEIMEDRYCRMEQQGQKQYNGDPLLIVIDELADLLISADTREIQAQLQRLTALGRAAKVKVVCATQCPNRTILKANIVLNFSARVALHCQTAIESRQVINVKGAEDLPMYGECLYLRPGHNLEWWDVPMTDEAEKQKAIKDCAELNKSYGKSKIINLFRRAI